MSMSIPITCQKNNLSTPRDFRYLVDPDSRLDSGLETTLTFTSVWWSA